MTTSMWTNTRHFFSTLFQVKPAPVLPDPTCAAPWQPAPWTKGRVGHAQFGVIALLMVLVNYACVVIYPSVNSQVRGGHVWEDYFVRILLFHVPLILAIASWIATCITDPGTPEVEWWQQHMESQPHAIMCYKSGMYKPPRSHFDSVTRRLTLNMDHFCPWVVNTIGFYNKKFFILFLFYVNLALLLALYLLVCIGYDTYQHASEREKWYRCGFLIAVASFDFLLIALLIPFFFWHLMMIARNQTTIESSSFPHYDVGLCANLRQVFGKNPWTWLVPCYFEGPEGDGLRWPTRKRDVTAMV